ncbi:MAG: hypothetical protein OJF51_002415 [Nitrospira sp.]|jgi:hypothetical protein|nr:MAG: hypothetical protein OJF51_002415 [Nitrospira sp.]
MLIQEVCYELCTETSKGFRPYPRIYGPIKHWLRVKTRSLNGGTCTPTRIRF